MYKCNHFGIEELVDPTTFEILGEEAWKLFDPKALLAVDLLRETFGSCTINSWKWGGNFQWSGYRSMKCTIGATKSMHRVGQAFDCKFKNITAEEVRQAIKKDEAYWKQYIGRIENNVSWLHIDTKDMANAIRWFNP